MTVLLEHRAKALLRRYGVPTTDARLARTAEEATALARAAGGPVAMKIAASGIVHKAAAGGVRLNVDAAEAAAAFGELAAAAGAAGAKTVEGVVVEPMAAPGHEAVVGAVRDPVFGPVVMCGVGGTGVEETANVAFRLAPLGDGGSPRSGAGGGLSRGRRRADGDPVGRRRTGRPAVPGKHRRAGHQPGHPFRTGAVAVDAHIALSDEDAAEPSAFGCLDPAARKALQREVHDALRPVFYPEGIVIVGASATPGKLGFRIVQNLVDFGYAGKLYPVHPAAETSMASKPIPASTPCPNRSTGRLSRSAPGAFRRRFASAPPRASGLRRS